MTIKKKKRDPFKKMYDELTDPIKQEEARRREARSKHLRDKKHDTGL